MPRYLLLVRGINVSGANIVKMAELRGFLAGLGFVGVETYIQSGNAVFGSKLLKNEVHEVISTAFAARFGFAPKMMLLKSDELAAAMAANPFTAQGVDPARLHLGVMAAPPGEGALTALAARPRTSEEYVVSGAAIYLFTPDGLGKSTFAAGIERTLKTPVTFRNWRTVLALAEMAALPERAVPLNCKF